MSKIYPFHKELTPKKEHNAHELQSHNRGISYFLIMQKHSKSTALNSLKEVHYGNDDEHK